MPVREPAQGEYLWSNVKKTGRILLFNCGLCRKRLYFDPADLIAVYGDCDWQYCPFVCSRCGKREFIDITMYRPDPGDYGQLTVRRPGKVKHVQTWKTVKLGDEVK